VHNWPEEFIENLENILSKYRIQLDSLNDLASTTLLNPEQYSILRNSFRVWFIARSQATFVGMHKFVLENSRTIAWEPDQRSRSNLLKTLSDVSSMEMEDPVDNLLLNIHTNEVMKSAQNVYMNKYKMNSSLLVELKQLGQAVVESL